MRRLVVFLAIFCSLSIATVARATIFGNVKGVVHDPQHRPIQDATITLKADDSDWQQTQKTTDTGEFEFAAVPVGDYTGSVVVSGFQQQQQSVIVRSDTSPVLHFELALATVNQTDHRIGRARGRADRDSYPDHHVEPSRYSEHPGGGPDKQLGHDHGLRTWRLHGP